MSEGMAFPDCGKKFMQRSAVSFGEYFYRIVGTIAHPSGYAALLRGQYRPIPKADALYPAFRNGAGSLSFRGVMM